MPFLLQVVRDFYALVSPGIRRVVDSYRNGGRFMPCYARDISNYLLRTRYVNEALVALREIVYCDPWQCEGEVRCGKAAGARCRRRPDSRPPAPARLQRHLDHALQPSLRGRPL